MAKDCTAEKTRDDKKSAVSASADKAKAGRKCYKVCVACFLGSVVKVRIVVNIGTVWRGRAHGKRLHCRKDKRRSEVCGCT